MNFYGTIGRMMEATILSRRGDTKGVKNAGFPAEKDIFNVRIKKGSKQIVLEDS